MSKPDIRELFTVQQYISFYTEYIHTQTESGYCSCCCSLRNVHTRVAYTLAIAQSILRNYKLVFSFISHRFEGDEFHENGKVERNYVFTG